MSFLHNLAVALGLATATVPAAHHALPPTGYLVTRAPVSDEKAVFATVETANVVPARARVGGTIAEVKVRQGDKVELGQEIALVGDPKLALQVNSYAAQVLAGEAQLAQARTDYDRAQRLMKANAISQAAFDQARTAYSVAINTLKSQQAQKAVAEQQLKEGAVLAPTSGRVLTVPVTVGTVVMAGDTLATVAEQDFVLRLLVPERHARFLKAGDPVRIDGQDVGLGDGPRYGTIRLVYPQIAGGRVMADAVVPGLTDYFVGERVRVWVSAGTRQAIVIPSDYLLTRFGMDYARVHLASGQIIDVPVQRGERHPTPALPGGIEILSGLHPGDRLVKPGARS
ncbi:MAG: efflux RND transporter periplasmic adaptor subunit [Alphaproteobacteria bacterium]|nr:efflux RND transporter periplasmic adaptor subunit [Alphaproteobacteria bacterium]MBU6473210.1 efflux RND transporter periplasmic adaptor subunit [Alphaproteobacteria bacterium]MDE2011628.1 efflux RND transporter periplasmic adaptor subunit [Alphaproteobacteria bacterium]MDE2073848.1 efflux RND transporter periplasmic adaptor subunit [Alphaproteobacteria bacterium]MDE2352442.1 efflux RND transporter periplasmic adaptor subunit [Alphaproteobacteria bacterium]